MIDGERVSSLADKGPWTPRRTGAGGADGVTEERAQTREGCPQCVGGGAPACHDSGRTAGVTTRDPRDKKVSHECGLAGRRMRPIEDGHIGNVGLLVARRQCRLRRSTIHGRHFQGTTGSSCPSGACLSEKGQRGPRLRGRAASFWSESLGPVVIVGICLNLVSRGGGS